MKSAISSKLLATDWENAKSKACPTISQMQTDGATCTTHSPTGGIESVATAQLEASCQAVCSQQVPQSLHSRINCSAESICSSASLDRLKRSKIASICATGAKNAGLKSGEDIKKFVDELPTKTTEFMRNFNATPLTVSRAVNSVARGTGEFLGEVYSQGFHDTILRRTGSALHWTSSQLEDFETRIAKLTATAQATSACMDQETGAEFICYAAAVASIKLGQEALESRGIGLAQRVLSAAKIEEEALELMADFGAQESKGTHKGRALAKTVGASEWKAAFARSHPELPKLREDLMVRAELDNDGKSGTRSKTFGQNWQVRDLNDAIRKFVSENPSDIVIERSNTKIMYTSPSSKYTIVEDPTGGYFRIVDNVTFDKSGWKKHPYSNWDGELPDGKDKELAFAQTHFKLPDEPSAKLANTNSLGSVRRLLQDHPLETPLSPNDQKILIENAHLLTKENEIARVAKMAETSSDPAWIPALKKLDEELNRFTNDGFNDWREKESARLQSAIAKLSSPKDGAKKFSFDLNRLSNPKAEVRVAELGQVEGKHLTPAETTTLQAFSKNAVTPEAMKELIRIAEESGDPTWIPTLSNWTERLATRETSWQSEVHRQAESAKHVVLEKMASKLNLGSADPPPIRSVETFLRQVQTMKDPSFVPLLKELRAQDIFTDTESSLARAKSRVRLTEQSPEVRNLKGNLDKLIRELSKK